MVLFKVSGLIDSQIHLRHGNVTVAGQTSPGGVTVRGWITDESPYQDQAIRPPSLHAENWVLRHIRIRPVDPDASDDGLRLRYTRRAMVDHVSIGNAFDEAVEISYSSDLTIQYSHIAETLGGHAIYGGVLINYSNAASSFPLSRISLHHNLFNRIQGRLPEVSRESAGAGGSVMDLELSNNLYWAPEFFIALAPDTGSYSGSGSGPVHYRLNAVGNRFELRDGFPYAMWDDQFLRGSAGAGTSLYLDDNAMSLYPGRADEALFYCCNDYPGQAATPDLGAARPMAIRHDFPGISYTPSSGLKDHLLPRIGAFPRDPMDRRLLGFVAQNRFDPAPSDSNPYADALLPAFTGAMPSAPVDTDADGMPDDWERSHGLNPSLHDPHAKSLSPNGYSNLEFYLNELAEARVQEEGAHTPPPAGSLSLMPLHRFFRSDRDAYFFTASEEEKRYVQTTLSPLIWRYEGVSQQVLAGSTGDALPVYRFLNRRSGTYFYTMSASERDALVRELSHLFTLEGIAFYALASPQTPGSKAVFRFYLPASLSHFFTASEEERDWIRNNLPDTRMRYDGVAWYAF
jgi:hypothetical protein